ncbi:MAG: HAD family hydrolase [Alphaproteobacteria bacterium]
MKRIFALFALIFTLPLLAFADNLPSWNEGELKGKIIEFIMQVSDKNSSKFVQPEDRIAVFDNDGTLWSEQPIYFQAFYAVDYVQKHFSENPGWAENPALVALNEKGLAAATEFTEHDLLTLVAVSHANMDSDKFNASVNEWITTATHPTTGTLYTQMVFQPMLELIDYLYANDFKVFIVSGGGIDFLRVWAPTVYNIPSERIIGSRLKNEYQVIEGEPVIIKLPELEFNDDKEGKPVAIHNNIGKKPILAVGNSDGDFQMLEWTTSEANNLGILLHHTDDEREFAYDRKSIAGKLDKGLEVNQPNWLIIDMKNDWNTVYPE